MPISTLKRQELESRRQVVYYLLKLGLSFREIGTALEIGIGPVRNDYKHLGGRNAFTLSSLTLAKRRDKTFADALKMYADLIYPRPIDTKAEKFPSGLRKALSSYLKTQRLRAIAAGIAGILQCMICPVDPPEYQCYRRLLNAIFGYCFSEVSPFSIFDK